MTDTYYGMSSVPMSDSATSYFIALRYVGHLGELFGRAPASFHPDLATLVEEIVCEWVIDKSANRFMRAMSHIEDRLLPELQEYGELFSNILKTAYGLGCQTNTSTQSSSIRNTVFHDIMSRLIRSLRGDAAYYEFMSMYNPFVAYEKLRFRTAYQLN